VLQKTTQRLITAAGIVLLVTGCGRDNGLPNDLTGHLAALGIELRASGSHAPLSSRAGYIFFDQNPEFEARIIAAFGLKEIDSQDPLFGLVSRQVSAKPIGLWGITGRPANLKLANGGQFEYLCLLTAADGHTYLCAEYAYG
jgi:hypothetical protein